MLACKGTFARFATLVEPVHLGAIAYHLDANGLIAAWSWILSGGSAGTSLGAPSNLRFS